jgi:peptidoglycan hydrolase-like protein with peptidoglycan-binding domain
MRALPRINEATTAPLREFMPLAIAGDSRAQFNIGLMYARGEGVAQSDAEAARWYRRAADQGDADAQTKLGAMYVLGQGVPQNDADAVRWFRLAANKGEALAQYSVGVIYANGRGVPYDPGPADGVMGPRTRAAIMGFEADVGLPVDGQVSDLAEQADLAVLRGGDVVRRAEGEVARRVDAASEAALETVTQERMVKLAALTQQVSKTQQELEQTRAGLLESWQRMDQSVAERQSEVLTSLDAYAGTIGVRVEELLEALDLMVARSGG